MENITMIAAVGKNLELGKDNRLLWPLKEDLHFFRENTMGKPIIMGFKTFASLPRLLSGRKHIVLTRKNIASSQDITIVNSLDDLLTYIANYQKEVMVIGGASIYKEMLPYASKMLLTEIDKTAPADAFFPNFSKDEWNSTIVGEGIENSVQYKHLVYTRKSL